MKPYFPYFHLDKCYKTSCEPGEFLCPFYEFCLSVELVCDGINHCFLNEDESFCGNKKLKFDFQISKFNKNLKQKRKF